MTKFDRAMALLSKADGFDREAIDRHIQLYDSASGSEQRAIGRTLEAWFQRAKTPEERAWLTRRLNEV